MARPKCEFEALKPLFSTRAEHCPQEGPFLPRPSFFVTDFVFVCEQLQAAMEMAGSSRMTIATTVLLLVLCHQQYGGVQLNVVASASVIDMVTTSDGESTLTSDGESTLKPNAKTDANAIIRAAFNSTIVYTRLAFLTDTFGPRFSGTSALESALDWIKDEAENGDGFSVKEQDCHGSCLGERKRVRKSHLSSSQEYACLGTRR
jgi:hypothetical protein